MTELEKLREENAELNWLMRRIAERAAIEGNPSD